MGAGNNAAALATQLERVRPELTRLYSLDDTLLSLIEEKSEGLEPVSSRAYRIPLNLLSNGILRQINPDGAGLGRGGAFKTDYGVLSQIFFAHPVEYTALAKVATDSKQKAIANYVDEVMKQSMEEMRTGIEALMQGDGSGTLDSVVSVTNNPVISVNNANQFMDGQTVQVFPNLTSASRGSFLILAADAIANTITIDPSSVMPVGTIAGDLLIVDGGSGIANSSINGVANMQLTSNVGTFLGIQRAAYPGRLSTPSITGGSVSPQQCRAMLDQVRLALGVDSPESAQWIWYMNVDMEAAIENIGLTVTQVIQNQIKGDSSVDMLMKTAPKTFGGRPIKASIHATPGRIDGLALKHWFRTEIQSLDFYEVNGQTLFPAYGADGGVETSFLTYLWTGFNLATCNPRAGVYSSGNTIPKYFFGH